MKASWSEFIKGELKNFNSYPSKILPTSLVEIGVLSAAINLKVAQKTRFVFWDGARDRKAGREADGENRFSKKQGKF